MAEKRLSCLNRRMKQNTEQAGVLRDKMVQYVSNGCSQNISQSELEECHKRILYSPIFVVQHPNKPSKIRLVQDAAFKYKGTSLNDNLFKGPDHLTPLVTILSQFREHPVAISEDIAEMFHQVQVISNNKNSKKKFMPRHKQTRFRNVYQERPDILSIYSAASAQRVIFVIADRFI